MLKDFAIQDDVNLAAITRGAVSIVDNHDSPKVASAVQTSSINHRIRTVEGSLLHEPPQQPRWGRKLFTHEDPIGVHKYLGAYCLLHFVFRFYQMLFGDPSAGLGSYRWVVGNGSPSILPILGLIPHGLLSVSSLIFHTVPAERVVGKPMIWKEYRAHNIIFGIRSVVTAAACALSIYFGKTRVARNLAVGTSVLTCLGAMIGADIATNRLRVKSSESTTATMPYWDGCSVQTQRRFKLFYAYCQFMATIACVTVTNPAYPLAVLLAIQLASLLMTLVRKGLLSARGYHYGYTATLVAPYFVAMRSIFYSRRYFEMPSLFAVGSILFWLRRQGISKYALWVPLLFARLLFGDKVLDYMAW